MKHRLVRLLLGIVSLTVLAVAQAQSDDELLRVEEAFALTSSAPARDSIALQWKIADGYYLYRSRIKTKTTQPGLTLGTLQLPAGENKHDEFLGEVEVYHNSLSASLPLTAVDASATTAEIAVTFQGCHEREPKICYPPHTAKLSVALPPPVATSVAIADAPAAAPTNLKAALGQIGKPAAAPMDSVDPGEPALPLPPEQAFRFETIAAGPTELLARWTMPKGYYLYRDKTRLTVRSPTGIRLGSPQWPAGTLHQDEKFGQVTVFFDQVELPIALSREQGDAGTLVLEAEFQGCEDKGVCYPIMTRTLNVDLPAATPEQLSQAKAKLAAQPAVVNTAASTGVAAGNAEEQSEEQVLAAKLSGNRLLALLTFFGIGLLLAFTPCVFPMIPILSGIIAGAGDNVTPRRAFVLSVVYVLASSVVFTIAGVVAGLAGNNLQAAFQIPWILFTFSALFVALAFSMFGFYDLQLPQSWQNKFAEISNRQQGGSLLGVAVMGFLSALIVGPCVAPPLAGAVLYIAQTRDPVFGAIALFVLSLGMGAPLVAIGTGAGWLLPRAGAWMNTVKAVFGVTFLWMALWISSRVLSDPWTAAFAGCLLVGSGVYMGALERLKDDANGWSKLWKSLGLIQVLIGAGFLLAMGLSHIQGTPTNNAGSQSAASAHVAFRTIKSVDDLDRELAQGKPVMLDFYADWCVSCKEMEKFTFARPEVVQALAGYTTLKVDVTANDAVDQALLKRFGLVGPPATIFFDAQGTERRGQRLIGFEAADKFVARVAKARR